MRDRRQAERGVPRDRRRGNRRAFPRWPVIFEARYGMGSDLVAGKASGIGEGGLTVEGGRAYDPGTTVDLEYRLDSSGEWVRVKGLVHHADGGRLGIEFLNLRLPDRLKIVDYITRTQPPRA